MYLESVDFTIRVHLLTVRLPWEWRHMGDQARRAAGSISLNIAEGAAHIGAEQRRYFRIARASAAECECAFFTLTRAGVVPAEVEREVELKTNTISAMLTAMMQYSERKEQTRPVTKRAAPANPQTPPPP